MANQPEAGFPDFARSAETSEAADRPAFSICTLVTRPSEYAEMAASFVERGFSPTDCEYLYLDNSGANRFEAFGGYNLFLSVARGRHVILCHQDILLQDDDRAALERRLEELTALAPDWALCGNAGGVALGRRAIRISDPHGHSQAQGPFPARATALDENFIVVRRDANLALSHDLAGFHFYGADLCIVADFLGRSAWVIDFHLLHKSPGLVDPGFYRMRREVARKYRRALRPRWIVTTVTDFFLSGSRLASRLLTSPAARIPRRAAQIVRRLKG
ncbi:MAG: acyl esterase [Alphaproteobacteria bacterium]|nr:acyl esterase [Alphaproteobacteria bacterium]MBV9372926.1 acyl esterase [Alphaproteobacteria bacterium]MBV9900955.1 acyl esterase [Alphaproteobacteria bacterium]